MDKDRWKIRQISEILGIPKLDTHYLPPHVIVNLKEEAGLIENLGALILYGSVVRGEASPKSDIDLMVVPIKNDNVDKMIKEVRNILNHLEVKYDLDVSFSATIYDGNEDSYYLWEMVNDGVVIYCRPQMLFQSMNNITPLALVSYSYKGLNENMKKRIHRFLFESKNGLLIDRKNKLEYIAPGVILLSTEKVKLAEELFDSLNVNYSSLKIWR